MKTAKKLTALLIILTLLFALSATAFAYDPTTQYTITFSVSGVNTSTWTLTPSAGTSVYSAIDNSALTVDFDPIVGPHYVLKSINGYEAEPGELEDIPSEYSNYNATVVDDHPGYFLLEEGDLGYHYLYFGHDWTYCYQNGGDLWLYMDECFPAAGSVMVVTYSLQVYDWWSEDPIV